MAYTPTTWANGTTPVNATNMNHLETQYSEASQSFEQDLFSAFVLSGLVASKDGSIANQLDVTAGVAFLLQSSDSTLRRRAPTSSTQTTSAANSTYYLDLNPDGTWSWATSHSAVANYLSICTVTTDASGNIATVTDTRTTAASLLSGMAGHLTLPTLDKTMIAPSNYDALVLYASSDPTYAVTLGAGDTAYGGGAGAYLYDDKGGGFVFKEATSTGITFVGIVSVGMWVGSNNGGLNLFTEQSGAKNGASFQTWNGTATVWPLSVGGNFNGAGTVIDSTGAVAQIAGQATAGSFGVPMIVAQALDTHVTTTGDVTLLTYAVPATGLYEINGYAYFGNTTAEAVTFRAVWTDAHGGTATAYFTCVGGGYSGLILNGSESPLGVAISVPTQPIVVEASSGTNILVHWNDPAGTPNDFVSTLIKRLS